MEVSEPVIDERDAREVRDLGWEVAGIQALGDRQMDAQVAPVRTATVDSRRSDVPETVGQDAAHEGCRDEGERKRAAVSRHGVRAGDQLASQPGDTATGCCGNWEGTGE